MDRYEIYTTGGGYFVQDILQFLALYTGSGDFDVLITIAITAGVLCLATSIILGLPARSLIKTFAAMTFAGSLFTGRTVDVDVHDKTYGTLSYYATVSNVPMGVALLAHYTTGVSFYVTEKLEQLISTPDDLAYQSNGMIFGASIVAQQARWHAVNGVIHERLVDFYQNCVVRGINLRYFDVDVIAGATDLSAATGANIPSSLSYFDVGTGTVETCADGWASLSTDVNDELVRVLEQKAASVYQRNPGTDGADTVSKLTNTLTAMQNKIGMSSATATNTVRQAMLINAFDDSIRRYAAISGNDASLSNLTNSIADTQRRSAYSNVGVAATKWVPYLKIVFEVIYYGAFPFAVMLMWTPMAWTVLKGYFGGYVWLASWEPVSAMLHGIVLEAASGFYREAAVQSASGLPTDIAMTWSNHFGVISAEQEIGATAGYLMMSVPFLCYAIFFGAKQMQPLATSMLNVGQGTAIEAGRAAATGQVALSTVSMNTMASNQWQTSSTVDTGRMSGYFDTGGAYTMNRDGSANFGGGSALPQGVGLSVSSDQGVRREVSRRASAARTSARTSMSEAADYVNQGASQFSSYVENASQGLTAGSSGSRSLKRSQSESLNNAKKILDQASSTAGVSSDVMMKAAIGKMIQLPLSVLANGDAQISALSNERQDQLWQATSSKDVQSAIQTIESIGTSDNWGDTSSTGTNANEGNRWSLDEGGRMTQSFSNSLRRANDLTRAESAVNTSGVVSSQQLTVMAQDALNEKFPNDPARVEKILNARDFGALAAQQGVLKSITDDLVEFYGAGGAVADGTAGFDATSYFQPDAGTAPRGTVDGLKGAAAMRHNEFSGIQDARGAQLSQQASRGRIPFDAEHDRIVGAVADGRDQTVGGKMVERGERLASDAASWTSKQVGKAQEWLYGEEPETPPAPTTPTAPFPSAAQGASLAPRERDAVIRTVLGEAGGDGPAGMAAVASVIQNRAADPRWPSTPGGVSLQPWQFSSWNQNPDGSVPNNRFSSDSQAYRDAGEIVDAVFAGNYPDQTGGAVNFYAPELMQQHYSEGKVRAPVPSWYDQAASERSAPDAIIGGHIFTGQRRG